MRPTKWESFIIPIISDGWNLPESGGCKEAGIDYGKMEEAGIVSPVVGVSCQYKSMVHFGDTVLVALKIEKYNGVKLSLSYRVTDKESGELRMTGNSEHCFMDRGGRLVSLKRNIRIMMRLL